MVAITASQRGQGICGNDSGSAPEHRGAHQNICSIDVICYMVKGRRKKKEEEQGEQRKKEKTQPYSCRN